MASNNSDASLPTEAQISQSQASTSSNVLAGPALRKGKTTKQIVKTVDTSEASKLISARISQLEIDAAGEKDQEVEIVTFCSELEIDREVKRANRDLGGQMSKMNADQRIDHLQKRCAELLAELKRLERENQKSKKRAEQLQKEKDQGRTELSKTNTVKEKIEKLARELSKENNRLTNESKALIKEKDENAANWDEKFTSLLIQVQEYQDAVDHPKQEIIDISAEELFKHRFKSFVEQYELRELHFHSLMRTKELEVQGHMARYEREKKNAEAEGAKARQLAAQVQAFSKTETELRSQLNVYVEKFKQVEETLNNSNDLFLTFRKEMEDMSRKTKRLEKENDSWKKKSESMRRNVVTMAEKQTKYEEEIADLRKRNAVMKSLVEKLQEERRANPDTSTGPSAKDDDGDTTKEKEPDGGTGTSGDKTSTFHSGGGVGGGGSGAEAG